MNDGLWRYSLFIDGKWRQASSNEEYIRHNPATGESVAYHQMATRADAELAVKAARNAFDNSGWAVADTVDRADILRKFADLVMDRQEELAKLESLITGSPIQYARSFVESTAEVFRFYSGLARDLSGKAYRFNAKYTGFTLREPIGVVSLIVPWNFPLGEVAWKLAPALAAGCAVIVKPDIKTAATALELGPLMKEAGLPDGVFNVVTGHVEEIGDVLTTHDDIDSLSFTGSTKSGGLVMDKAAESIKPLHLELGGKSPFIILEDADIDKAAQAAAMGIFWHNGQVCTACSRILVQSSIAEEFIKRLGSYADQLTIGDPLNEATEIGPLISKEHREHVLDYVELGKVEGANLFQGGRVLSDKNFDQGAYMLPTIFTDVEPSMRIAQEEIFGPVACIMTFKSLDEALDIANGTQYGLGAGVWTSSTDSAFQAVHRLQSGNVWVNDWGGCRSELPWGGCKKSGFGRELGHEALEIFLQTKSVHITHSTIEP